MLGYFTNPQQLGLKRFCHPYTNSVQVHSHSHKPCTNPAPLHQGASWWFLLLHHHTAVWSACSPEAFCTPCVQVAAAVHSRLHCSSNTTLNPMVLHPRQLGLAAVVLPAVPAPGRGTRGEERRCKRHQVLWALQQAAKLFCHVTLQTRWHTNSSSRCGREQLSLPRCESKDKEVWQRKSIKQ